MVRREPDDWTALWNEISQVFSPGALIDESDLFAGRVEQLGDLINAVNQRGQHATVFGDRGVGKTSLANTFTMFMHRPSTKAVAKRINCDGVTSFQSLWRKVFDEINLDIVVHKDPVLTISDAPLPPYLSIHAQSLFWMSLIDWRQEGLRALLQIQSSHFPIIQ